MSDVFTRYLAYLRAERSASPYTIRNYTNDLMEFFDYLNFSTYVCTASP